MHKIFKVLADATYVQPTGVVGPTRWHATPVKIFETA